MKARKVLGLFVVLGVLLCALGGVLSAEAAETTLERIARTGRVVIGTAPGYYPFEMVDRSGELIGYDIDLGQAIAEALGATLEWRQFEFAGLIPAIQTGEIDLLIAGMSITGRRALAVSFSNPYFETGQVLMVPKSDTETTSWQDLDQPGKRIGTPQGQTSAILAEQLFKHAELMHFPTFPETSMALMNGQLDGVIYDKPGILVWEARHPELARGIYDLISLESLGIATRLNDFAMIQWLNSFLFQYRGSPREMASRTRWMYNIQDWLREVESK